MTRRLRISALVLLAGLMGGSASVLADSHPHHVTHRRRRVLSGRLTIHHPRHHRGRNRRPVATIAAPAPTTTAPQPSPTSTQTVTQRTTTSQTTTTTRATTTTSATTPTTTTASTTTTPPARITHIVWIFLENQDYTSIYGPEPYETQLADQYGLAEDYYAAGHYSTDNYIAATSGVIGQCNADQSPSSCPQARDNLFHQLGAGNAQDLVDPGNTDSNHDPAEYYTDLGSGYESTLPSSFTASTFAPAFTFISPNRTDDGHDSSAATADQWLSAELPKILATPQYQSGSMAVFVVYDESNINDTEGNTIPPANHVYAAVVSPYTTAVKDSTVFSHCSLLRTAEDLLGVAELGCAGQASSMVSVFGLN